jgi:hypothetical protein
MTGRYASATDVPTSRSRDEIERILSRYGASHFAYGTDPDGATIGFAANGKAVRFYLPLPRRDWEQFLLTPTGRDRSETAARQAWEQACRQSWRALALVVKAKLEAVAAGITTFEDEFLAHMILPDGSTFGEWARPQLDAVYANGGRTMPALLPGGG